ncbi:succinate dehydrogenase assembly factor 4, mitochondrial isoform X1 [Parus major]|uniref:succinate dehydrogenase assembly factor 4, mitochondrial isoform X1 n=1 Tax=Parus major TaxID=9157 RepID=UPI00144424E2|nr:succinate dehydrogenase assembly factor 4, mitochondrial isoform X1 [Parus major]
MAAESSLLCHSRSSSSSKPGGRSEPAKQPLKKPKLPVGRFDEPEESSMEKEPLEKPAVSTFLELFSCSSQIIAINNSLEFSIREMCCILSSPHSGRPLMEEQLPGRS